MDGALHAIQVAIGGKWWMHHLDRPIGGSPAVVDGVVYVATTAGLLMALTSYNRRCLMTRCMSRWDSAPEDTAARLVVLAASDHAVSPINP
jgi:PQQ-like domain